MIIEAKANRQSAEAEDPRKRLESEPEKTSRLPVYFALMITGIAAYLKSAFPAQSQDDASGPGNSPTAPRETAPKGSDEGVPEVDDVTTGSIDDEKPGNSIGHASQPWESGFVMAEPVSFSYTAGSFEYLGPAVTPFFPAAVNYLPQNDNGLRNAGAMPSLPGRSGPSVPPPRPIIVDDDDDDVDPGEDEDDGDDDDDEVHQPNRAPVAMGPVRLHDVFAGQVVLIGLSQLLLGSSDPDGDVLTINDISVSGGTLVQVDGGWSFATFPGMLGLITFTYDISDGLLEIVQTASLLIVRNTVLLTPFDDVFVGTPYDDDVDGLAGDDIIDVRAGNDVVVGGLGDDHINGGDGDDQLFGGRGDDVIFGGRGNDIIGGGDGDDRLFGEDGNDIIDGDAGDDLLMGGAGDDILNGGSGDDLLDGGDGDDALFGGTGDDTASGGQGSDVIDGDEGDDVLMGDAGTDIIDGGDGDDEVDGGAGDDVLRGGRGHDIVVGDQGNDQLYGGAGDDTLVGDAGDDLLDGGEGLDTLFGGDGDDTLLGGDDDDEIYGGAGSDQIDAGAGDDEIYGGADGDTIDGGDGYDVLDYSDLTVSLTVNIDEGVVSTTEVDEDLFTHIEEIIGGQGDDVFLIGATAAVISGGQGDDLFVFMVTDNTPAVSHQLVHDILDFVVGDRIHLADYAISRTAERLEAERFEQFYSDLDEGFESALPIRVTHAFYDDTDHTIIEADVDRDDFYEIAITLHGFAVPLHVDSNLA
jgi:Ca2+-binding RTX toxin-like protein